MAEESWGQQDNNLCLTSGLDWRSEGLQSPPHALTLTAGAVRVYELSGAATAVLQAGVEVPGQQRVVQ